MSSNSSCFNGVTALRKKRRPCKHAIEWNELVNEGATYRVQPILVFDFFETAVAVVLTDNFEIVMLKCGKIHGIFRMV